MNFLPGWHPGLVANRTLQQVASATANASSITGPAAIRANDILVLFDRATNTTLTIPTSAVPSGFTIIDERSIASTLGMRAILSRKVATGAEASASLSGMTGSSTAYKMLYVFRPDFSPAGVSTGSVNGEATDGDPAAQSVTIASVGLPTIVLAAYGVGGGGSVDPRGFSPTKDGEINFDTAAYLAYKIFNSAPVNVAIDMDDDGARNSLQSCYLSVL